MNKRIISFVLALVMMCSMLPNLVHEVDASVAGVEALTCASFISNEQHRKYIDFKIKDYINNNSSLQTALNDGKSVIMMFEGGSDNYPSHSYSSSGSNVRDQAVVLVIKKVNGTAQIAFYDEYCSSLPAQPEDTTGGASNRQTTLMDGIYSVQTCNHKGQYGALNVIANTGYYTPSSNKDGWVNTASGINIHTRSSTTSGYGDSAWSWGCQLIGRGNDSGNSFNEFMKVVTGIDFNVWLSYSNKQFNTVTAWQNVGYYVLDRQLALEGLRALYTDYALNQITANSGGYNTAPEKPVLNHTINDKTVTFTWNPTENTTHYNLWIEEKNADGDWEYVEQIFYAESGVRRTLQPGEYRAQLLSYNSNDYESDGSDWLHTYADDVFFTIERDRIITYFDAFGNVWRTQQCAHGEKYTLVPDYPTLYGAYFSGWAYSDGMTDYAVRPGETLTIHDDLYLYPVLINHHVATSGDPVYIYNIADFTEEGYTIEEVEIEKDQQVVNTYWTDWSEYSTIGIDESDTVEVRTAPMYRYYYYLCPSCGRHEPFWGTSDCGATITRDAFHYAWFTKPYSQSNYQTFSYTNSKYYTTELGDGQLWIFGAANLNDTAAGTTDPDSGAEVITTGYSYRNFVEEYETITVTTKAYKITEEKGVCGDNLSWYIEGNHLIITGSGPMYDFGEGEAPWYGRREEIEMLTISYGVTNIGKNAFAYCENLEYANLPGGIKVIDNGAFDYCTSLKKVVIPDGVTNINLAAFYNCKSMTSITIPESVTYIGDRAFNWCTGLQTVNYTGSKSQWDKITIISGNGHLTGANIVYGKEDPVPTLVKVNGVWKCMLDGKPYTANTLIKYNGGWYHVKGGQWVRDTGFVKYNGKSYYVVDGVWNRATTLVKISNGSWVYVKDGIHTQDTTLVNYNGNWLYVKNGTYTKATAFVKYNGNTYYVVSGQWSKTTTGLIKISDGSWVYVKNGVQDMSNTLVKHNGSWYHVNGGKWVKDTTLVKYDGRWLYVKNGLYTKATAFVKYNGSAYYVVNGQWSKSTNALIKVSDGSWVCVKNGVQDMSNTLFKYNDNWYHVSGGKWVRDTTLVQRNGATYYVKNGVVDFSYTGKFTYNGKTYNIVKGVVM